MELEVKAILIIVSIIIFLHFIGAGKKFILRVYYFIMIFSSILIGIHSFQSVEKIIRIPNIYLCAIMGVIAIIIYIIDFAVLNMVKNDTLILDFKYYFKGNINKVKFLISSLFSIMEEIVFRTALVEIEKYIVIYLLISSISFGLIHIFFSKYDCFSKFILGIILGIICLVTKSLIYPMIVHVIYNYLVLKIKE